MDEIKKYCQPGVYVPCSQFPSFYRSTYNLSDTSANFLWLHFCRSSSKKTLIDHVFSLHPELQNGWLYTCLCEVSWSSEGGCTELGHHIHTKANLHVFGIVLAAIHHSVLTTWRKGLGVPGTIWLFGDCTVGSLLAGFSPAPVKLRKVKPLSTFGASSSLPTWWICWSVAGSFHFLDYCSSGPGLCLLCLRTSTRWRIQTWACREQRAPFL